MRLFQHQLFSTSQAGQTGKGFLLKPDGTRVSTPVAWLCTRVLAVLSLCLLVGSLLIVQGASQVFAAQAAPAIDSMPPTDWSFYMDTSSTSATDGAYDLGCDQGATDAADHRNSLVILDFGAQKGDGSGAYFPGTLTFISNSNIEADAEAAAQGYQDCTHGETTTTVLSLGIGTNNSGSNVGPTNGAIWAQLVNTVRFIAPSDVAVYGANDIESWCNSSGGGCASAAAAKDWARGYSGVGGSNYIDFGSADQCPTNTYSGVTCGNTGWTQYDYWYLSWGNPEARPAPEIYHDDWAMKWEMIDLYGVHHWPASGAMLFEGPMDEFDLDNSTDTAAQAWNALRSALEKSSSTDQQFFYSLEVHSQ